MNRFAYICADPGIPLPGTKGSSVHVASVCRALRGRGYQGEVHSTRATAETVAGFPLHALDSVRSVAGEDAAAREARLFLEGRTAPRLRDRHCRFVYERYSLWHTGGLALARRLGVPFILEVNSPLPEEARRFRSLHHARLAEGVAELLLEQADRVVCVSRGVADWALASGARKNGIVVVPNGVDTSIFAPDIEPMGESSWRSSGPVVAFAGSFRPWHGLDCLIEAFARVVSGSHPGATLLCVGDGAERTALERRASELGLRERLHITGMVPQADVARWLRRADVAVAPYPELDGFYFSPLKLFEFMALGLPVVASDIGQVREVMAAGRGGWLYRAGSIDELAGALASALSAPSEARRRALDGRRWVERHATWDRRVGQILDGLVAAEPASPAATAR